MRILYVHQYFSTLEGSIGNRSYWQARGLVERGHKVTVLCGRTAGSGLRTIGLQALGVRSVQVDGIRVIQVPVHYSPHLGGASRMFSFVLFALLSSVYALAARYDLLFASSTPLTVAMPGLLSKALRKKFFVFEVRDLWPDFLVEMGLFRSRALIRSFSILERLAYQNADSVVGLAPGIVDKVLQFRDAQSNVLMIPNGCDLELFRASPKQSVSAEEFAHRPLRAIYAGSFGRANGLEFLLLVAHQLDILSPGAVELVLVGFGGKKSSLMHEAHQQGLGSVKFLDPVPKVDMPKLFSEHDVGLQILQDVRGFRNSTSPNKVFDYLAAGLPVVTNQPGWIWDYLSEYDCGRHESDPKLFAEVLLEFRKNPDTIVTMGRNSRNLAEGEFNRRFLARKLVSLLEQHS